MWGFTEKEIEQHLARPIRRRIAAFQVASSKYVVLWTQPELVIVEKSSRNTSRPLFRELAVLRDFLPRVEGRTQYPDILAYRKPKGAKEIVVIELKATDATDRDVAQLRRYVNLLRYHLKYDIGGIRAELKLGGSRYAVRGMLLAMSIPKSVWLAACVPYDDENPIVELVAYELESHQSRRGIKSIRFRNFTEVYRQELLKAGNKYKSQRRASLQFPTRPEPASAPAEAPAEQHPPFQLSSSCGPASHP